MTRQEIIDAIKEMLERCYCSYQAKSIKAWFEAEYILRRLEAGEEIEAKSDEKIASSPG